MGRLLLQATRAGAALVGVLLLVAPGQWLVHAWAAEDVVVTPKGGANGHTCETGASACTQFVTLPTLATMLLLAAGGALALGGAWRARPVALLAGAASGLAAWLVLAWAELSKRTQDGIGFGQYLAMNHPFARSLMLGTCLFLLAALVLLAAATAVRHEACVAGSPPQA